MYMGDRPQGSRLQFHLWWPQVDEVHFDAQRVVAAEGHCLLIRVEVLASALRAHNKVKLHGLVVF